MHFYFTLFQSRVFLCWVNLSSKFSLQFVHPLTNLWISSKRDTFVTESVVEGLCLQCENVTKEYEKRGKNTSYWFISVRRLQNNCFFSSLRITCGHWLLRAFCILIFDVRTSVKMIAFTLFTFFLFFSFVWYFTID